MAFIFLFLPVYTSCYLDGVLLIQQRYEFNLKQLVGSLKQVYMILNCKNIGKSKRFMTLMLLIFLVPGCETDTGKAEFLAGRWQLFKICGSTFDAVFVPPENQRIEEYTCECESISYDYMMNETGRRRYKATDEEIIIFGTNENGSIVKFRFSYWIASDTLRVRYDGGFNYYDEFFVRLGDPC